MKIRNTKSPLPTDKHVGARIKARRLELRMSQGKLADQLGVTFQQVQKYEKGANRVGSSRLQQIAGALKVSISFFFDGIATAKPGSHRDADTGMFDKFFASADGSALAEAFLAIKSKALRRSVLNVVEQIAAARK